MWKILGSRALALTGWMNGDKTQTEFWSLFYGLRKAEASTESPYSDPPEKEGREINSLGK